MSGIFITVATTGAESSSADNPGIPVQPNEIAQQAAACAAAGAAMIHIHGRNPAGEPTLDLGVLADIIAQLRAETDLVVQLSTGGNVHDTLDDRMRVLDAAPESCSITCGTVNFGSDVFLNPLPFIEELYQQCIARLIVPEFECFDFGHIATLHRLLDKYGAPASGTVHCNLVMGVPGGMPGDATTLVAARNALPRGASWSATGIGRSHLPVLLATLALGGNVRVGMEDVLKYSATELVTDNAQLVTRAADLARIAQFSLHTPDEVRVLLGVA